MESIATFSKVQYNKIGQRSQINFLKSVWQIPTLVDNCSKFAIKNLNGSIELRGLMSKIRFLN